MQNRVNVNQEKEGGSAEEVMISVLFYLYLISTYCPLLQM